MQNYCITLYTHADITRQACLFIVFSVRLAVGGAAV